MPNSLIAVTVSFATFTCLSLITQWTSAQEDASENRAQKKKCKLNLVVTDESGTPIRGAEIEVLKWTGKLESIGVAGSTGGDGNAVLDVPYSDDYFYLKFACEGYATSQRDLQLSPDEEKTIRFKLSRPVQSWIKLTAGGKPLAGAEFSFFEITDSNQTKSYVTKEIAEKLGIAMNTSDSQGRLDLPLLPIGADLKFTVVHADYKSVGLSELTASASQIAEANLESGVRVTIDLGANEATKKEIEGKLATISLLSMGKPSRDVTSLMHNFPVRNGKVEFTAYAMEYQSLRFAVDDFFTSPTLINDPSFPNKDFDLTKKQSVAFQLELHSKAKARGRVVDAEGNGLAHAFVTSSIEFAETADPTEKVDDRATRFYRSRISGGNGETDSQGYYDIELIAGKNVELEVIQEGYFSAPSTTKCKWSGKREETLPTITQLPVPILKGIVVDAEGKPVIGSIVQMRHKGYGDADPIGESSAGGSFELKMSRLPYQPKGEGKLTTVYALAFDPLTNRSGMTEVDLTDPKATESIRVEIGERPAAWPLTALERPVEDEKTRGAQKEAMAKQRKEFAKGLLGNTTPAMSEGTWLNTDAKSLEDFRGRYVLLDFWFIGCGPCERDFPAVQLAHKKFSDLGFTVVGVHTNAQMPEDVQSFADAKGMKFPIVVDNTDGSILKQYRELGVYSFPSYILLDREGRIIHNDHTSAGSDPFGDHSLRMNKLEMIFKVIRDSVDAKPK